MSKSSTTEYNNGSEQPTTAPSFADLMSDIEEESDLDKVMKTFLDPANINHLTELNDNQIYAFSVLSQIAMRYNLTSLKGFLAEFLMKQVSRSRKGRAEFVRIAQRTMDAPEDHRGGGGMFSWLRRS